MPDWRDRLVSARYTAPDGTSYAFEFEAADGAFERQSTAYSFPGVNGTYIQDFGHTGLRLPLVCIFHGENHDLEARSFEDALRQPGFGALRHPAYGEVTVIPYGSINVQNRFVFDMHTTRITVSFWETLPELYTRPQVDPGSVARTKRVENLSAYADFFESAGNLQVVRELERARNALANTVARIRAPILEITDRVEEAKAVFSGVLGELDLLATLPGTVFSAVLLSVDFLSSTTLPFNSVVQTVDELIDGIENRERASANEYVVDAGVYSAIVSSLARKALETEYTSRTEALEAAQALSVRARAFNDWNDTESSVWKVPIDPTVYETFRSLIVSTIAYAVQLSFTLRSEIQITVNRPWSPVALCAHVYGTLDELDFFVRSNVLAGTEHFEIKRGRAIVYLA